MFSALCSLSDNNWAFLLFEKVNEDSSTYKILINNSLKKEQFKSFGTMSSDSLDFLWYKGIHNDYFKVAEQEADSLKIIMEPSDSEINIKIEKEDR